jgi:hypothetical protein
MRGKDIMSEYEQRLKRLSDLLSSGKKIHPPFDQGGVINREDGIYVFDNTPINPVPPSEAAGNKVFIDSPKEIQPEQWRTAPISGLFCHSKMYFADRTEYVTSHTMEEMFDHICIRLEGDDLVKAMTLTGGFGIILERCGEHYHVYAIRHRFLVKFDLADLAEGEAKYHAEIEKFILS